MNSRLYNVLVCHPTNFHSGWHEIRVRTNGPHYKQCAGWRNADSSEFGCSRDYDVQTDYDCLKLFLAEHACTIKEMVLL